MAKLAQTASPSPPASLVAAIRASQTAEEEFQKSVSAPLRTQHKHKQAHIYTPHTITVNQLPL